MPCNAHHAGNALVAVTLAASLLAMTASAGAEENLWPTLKQVTFGDRAIEEDGKVVLDAPLTAEDASLVPLTVRVPPEVKGKLKSLTLVIDKNPNPVVAKFEFGPAAGTNGERSMSTRVRVDNFSHVRAILETEDGTLHMATKFVQAAGGCAAMNAKDPDKENADLGKMLVKVYPPALSTAPLFEGQVMLKHPNSNGMQLDIDTRGYIPARFIKEMTVRRGNELVFRMESTFSISANPNFRFTYGRGGENELDVSMVDTDGAVFTAKSQPSGS
ncbi:MAG TPA: quinoprotein dehydrogenase-associated SoxYZ-like carrier [Hyphomicrobiales bacterium]|jgi:sulfur-oxidizing protein SoxY